MSDSSQSIVFETVALKDARDIGASVIAWMQAEGIIMGQPSDCVLGSAAGYAPGLNYSAATDCLDPMLAESRTNGVECITQRTVFDAGENGIGVHCEDCDAPFDDVFLLGDAISEWFDSTGEGLLHCASCGVVRPFTQWRFDPKYGFANFGLTFWNWPPLSAGFLDRLRERVGHNPKIVHRRV